ncbi:MAG: HypC/HybG/HupF family hydrogenase formation chaperone [Rhodospirillaceae bacterium]|jgi:hydrogenase expression/formation protein HypC|nr:HypC/HybG/HupF family hydrogenase formation chaperone [Rhodospirillaceae bacterium]
MCLALPVKVHSINTDADTAVVSLEGVKKEISLALVEDVEIGDYVLVHVGFALNKVSPEEAEKTLALMAEAGLIGANDADAVA